jgi:hypothetical protein
VIGRRRTTGRKQPSTTTYDHDHDHDGHLAASISKIAENGVSGCERLRIAVMVASCSDRADRRHAAATLCSRGESLRGASWPDRLS